MDQATVRTTEPAQAGQLRAYDRVTAHSPAMDGGTIVALAVGIGDGVPCAPTGGAPPAGRSAVAPNTTHVAASTTGNAKRVAHQPPGQ